MLRPQVWNFESSSPLTSTTLCDSEEEIFQAFKYQYFNHFVSITIPDANQIPKELVEACLDDSQYYRINEVLAAELVNKNFVDYFVRKGELTAFSIFDFSEEDRAVLTPCGKLIFSLTKSTYQTIGVEGTFTKYSKSSLRKYFLVLDLLSDTREVKKMCEQLEKKLSCLKNLCFDLILTWEPHDKNICPSSVAQYFHQKNYKIRTCEISYNQRFGYNVSVPEFDKDTNLPDFIEWVGAFGLHCDESSDDFVSSMKYTQHQVVLGQVIYMSFVGLITQKRLQRLISNIKYTQEKASSMWVTAVTQGFQDSILTIKNQKMFMSEGDQHKTVIFIKNQPALIYSFQDIKR